MRAGRSVEFFPRYVHVTSSPRARRGLIRNLETRKRAKHRAWKALRAFAPFAPDLAKELHLLLLQLVEEVEPGLKGLGIDVETFAQAPVFLVKEGAVLTQVGRDQFVAQFLVMRHPA